MKTNEPTAHNSRREVKLMNKAQERALETVEAEKKLLASLFVDDGDAVPKVMEVVNVEDFYRPEHRTIYGAITRLVSEGTLIDALLVEQEIKRAGDRVDRVFLFGLLELEYTTARAEHYAASVKEYSRKRQLETIGRELIDEATHDRKGADDILQTADKKLTAVMSTTAKKAGTAEDILKETILELHNRKEGLIGVPTGFYDLDKISGGLKKSDLIILAARPSMGKTALALNIAAEAASRKKVTLMFSLEMSRNQLMQRILSANTRIPATRLQLGVLNDNDWEDIYNSAADIGEWPLHIDDTAGITLTDLKMEARRIKREHGLDLIVVDYIQLMQGSKEYRGNRVQEVSELSRGLKALARELDVPVLALSQLSRAVEQRAEKKPQLSDLRESGSIEQDADIVMFLYRQEYYEPDEQQNLAELIIAKNRNGSLGTVKLRFEKDIVLFQNFTRVERYV